MEEEKKEVIELNKSEETTNNSEMPVVELTKVEKTEEKQETSATTQTDNTTETTKKYEENNKKGLCIASLVLGLVALLLWCLWYVAIPCGILAIIFGIAGLKSPNKGMAITGLITGIIGIIITGIIVFVLFMIGVTEGFSEALDKNHSRNYHYNYSIFD